MASSRTGKPSRSASAAAKGNEPQKKFFGKKSPPKKGGMSGDKPKKKGGFPFK
jgi:hypothetical protein